MNIGTRVMVSPDATGLGDWATGITLTNLSALVPISENATYRK